MIGLLIRIFYFKYFFKRGDIAALLLNLAILTYIIAWLIDSSDQAFPKFHNLYNLSVKIRPAMKVEEMLTLMDNLRHEQASRYLSLIAIFSIILQSLMLLRKLFPSFGIIFVTLAQAKSDIFVYLIVFYVL